MITHGLVFLLSLVVLVKSADFLVDYAARIARRLGVSDLVVGLTLTSIGTSVPELASGLSASLQGNSGLVIGNVVGSNIANIGLIAGVAATIRPFSTDKLMHDRDGAILLAASIAFFVLVLDNGFGRVEGIAFLAVYAGYVSFLAQSDREQLDSRFRYFLDYVVSLEMVKPLLRRRKGPKPAEDDQTESSDTEAPTGTIFKDLLVIALAGVGVIVGAKFLVEEATWVARLFGVPDAVIGLSLVAIGTSLPELLVAIAAAKKGNASMVIGNVMGSNLANLLLIVGVSSTVRPLEVQEISVVYTIPIMLFFTLGLLYIVRTGWRITRWQGIITLLSYLSFMGLAFWRGWS